MPALPIQGAQAPIRVYDTFAAIQALPPSNKIVLCREPGHRWLYFWNAAGELTEFDLVRTSDVGTTAGKIPTIPVTMTQISAPVKATVDSITNLTDPAAFHESSDYATALQGARADSATQPNTLATVATSGSYADLANKPTIPAAQVNADWNANSGIAQVLNKPLLASVATTGSYSDLSGKPTLGSAAAQDTTAFATAAQGTKADLAAVASTTTSALAVKAALPVAAVDLTAQSAAIGSTALYTAPVSGVYRVTWTATVTRAASVSSILGGTATGLQLIYTSADDSTVITTVANLAGAINAANILGAPISGVAILYAKINTAINYQFGYTSVGGTSMQYALHVRVEALQ